MAGEVTVIAKLAPQNDSFTGLVDGRQVIGDGATNVVPDLAISASSVTQHEGEINHENLVNAGIDIRNEGYSIYVDPAGSDDAYGDIANPLQTLWGAIQKVPVQGLCYIYLAAGTYTLPNWSTEPNYFKNTVIQSEGRVAVMGTVTTIETFTVLSCVGNVITATPDPGWTVDEHKGRCIRWGSSYHYWIISNTSDTLTVCITTSDIGGTNAKPTGSISICELASIIAPGTNNGYTSYLYTTGRAVFKGVHFNGTAGGSAGRIGITGYGGSALTITECKFSNWSWYGITGGDYLSVYESMFDNCAVGIAPGVNSVINGNNFFYNYPTGVGIENRYTNGIITLNHGSAAWMENLGTYIRIGNNTTVDDACIRVWASGTCGTYVECWALSVYKNSAYGLIGMSGALTFTTRVFYLKEPLSKILLYNSSLTTLEPNASYFLTPTKTLSLTDYIAAGKDVEFEDGNVVKG